MAKINRRQFIGSLAAVGAGAAVAPYILPSGRLFARTGTRRVGHVVFCLFAGGVRNIESVRQEEGGNLMPGLLHGSPSTIPGLDPLPAPTHPSVLQDLGTLYREFRYAQGPTGHYNGHTVAITGQYTNTGLNLNENPEYPTVFELYRKHNSPRQSALNAWWVANDLGPYPSLNYSRYGGYGPQFGANHVTPTAFLANNTVPLINNPLQFDPDQQARTGQLKNYLNKNFNSLTANNQLNIVNTPEDAERVTAFMEGLLQGYTNGQYSQPLGLPGNVANGDIYNVAVAEEILREFEPELLAVNMQSVDIGHQNFTEYCNNLRKADYAVSHLWNTIQSLPSMRDDTVLVIVPEHGRNLNPNNLVDQFGKGALDHTGDPTSREIFCMVVGPSNVVRQGQEIGSTTNPIGQSIDVVPTIAWLLGFDVDVPSGLLPGSPLLDAFV